MINREPTGRVVNGPEGPELILRRVFDRPVDEVWMFLTEPGCLAQWYGTWTGDPSEGAVQFTMVEAPDAPGECRIRRCESPARLAVALVDSDGQEWNLDISLVGRGEGTRMTFRQPLGGFAASAGDIGPGWEYYLDRLAAALHGEPVEDIDFAWYHPSQAEHYRTVETSGAAESRHISTVIHCTPDEVYSYVVEATNLSEWAAGLAAGETLMDGDALRVESPMGPVTVRFAPRNDWGVLDHEVTLADGTVTANPMRVLPHPQGAEVVFTLRRLKAAPEDFDRDAAMVAEDLERLRAILEGRPRDVAAGDGSVSAG